MRILNSSFGIYCFQRAKKKEKIEIKKNEVFQAASYAAAGLKRGPQ